MNGGDGSPPPANDPIQAPPRTRLLICPFSGGVESAVAAAHAALDPRNRVVLATMLYGQQSQQQELARTQRLAQWLRERYDTIIEHAVLRLGEAFADCPQRGLIWRGGAAWSPALDAWCPRSALLRDELTVESRLDAFALLAMSGANVRARAGEATGVVLGLNREDSLRLPQLAQAPLRRRLARLAAEVALDEVALDTPFADFDKSVVVELGLHLRVPLELTWSCYCGGERPCDACDQCRARAQAFESLGLDDPLRAVEPVRAKVSQKGEHR